jgi:DNA-binding MarR family transcriptional regulator
MNTGQRSAYDVLETVPAVMRFIRERVRHRRAGGVSLAQFRALSFLNACSHASLSDAAGHLGVSPGAMSRLIDGLVADGLVRRREVSTNRRKVALTVTARGRTTLKKIRGEIRLHLLGALRDVSTDEHKTVQQAMQILHRRFDRQLIWTGESPAKPRI